MNILHVTDRMDPSKGGVCQAVRNIILGFDKMEIQNEVVSLDSPNTPFLLGDTFPIHALGPGKSSWNYSKKLIPWLVENCPRFDAIILHGLWQYNGNALYRAFQSLKKNQKNVRLPKFYVFPHGMLDPYFQKAPDRKIKAIRNWVYWKLIEGKVVNQADGLLFTCEEERRLAREPFKPYLPKQEFVVGLGVEEPPSLTSSMREAFLEKCPSLRSKPYLLFLSRIHEKKGVDSLINAYGDIYKKRQKQILSPTTSASGVLMKDEAESNYHELPILVIAGPGLNSTYGKRIQNLVPESMAPEGAILFPGMLSGESKWGAFYGCEAFVLPSHQENFGIAVVEALACGKPVLISNQVNIWREIEIQGAGIVEDDSLSGTVRLLRSWMGMSKENKKAMGFKATLTYATNFSIPPATDRLIQALKGISKS